MRDGWTDGQTDRQSEINIPRNNFVVYDNQIQVQYIITGDSNECTTQDSMAVRDVEGNTSVMNSATHSWYSLENVKVLTHYGLVKPYGHTELG